MNNVINLLNSISLVTLILLTTQIGRFQCQSYLNFTQQHYYVEERNEEVKIEIERSGDLTTRIFFICKLEASASQDFQSIKAPSSIEPNSDNGECSFIINDDQLPEGNETFVVFIELRAGQDVSMGSANETKITILLSDDPYGYIGFVIPGQQILVEEPVNGQHSVYINLTRYGGDIGDVGIFWQVTQTMDHLHPDLQPANGSVLFTNGQSQNAIHIQIQPDDIPEPTEIFTIRLTGAYGGAKLLTNATEVEIRINENDAPIRFQSAAITFQEAETKQITITRGLRNGQRIGSIDNIASVRYRTRDGTAKEGVDYTPASDLISFERGHTHREISIQVLKDSAPELQEQFTIELYQPSDNVILSDPQIMTVYIVKNGDPHGIVDFNKTHIQNNTIILDEDDDLNYKQTIALSRTQGHFGNITVSWGLEPFDNSSDPATIFHSVEGDIDFKNSEIEAEIDIELIRNAIPSEALQYKLRLLSIEGGGRLQMQDDGGLPSLDVIIKDSDDVYGIVEFDDTPPNVIMSSTPRRFELQVRRNAGNRKQITVDYQVYYFTPGSSMPPLQPPVNNAQGRLTFNENQQTNSLSVEIRNDAFLQQSSYFLVTLLNPTLNADPIIPASSPIIGQNKHQYVNISENLANGEIGFYDSPISLTVNEPRTVELLLMRDGTQNEATMFWMAESDNELFTSQDMERMQGTIYFPQGVNNVSMSIGILDDQTPELDETFQIVLYNVSGRNEKLRNGATRASITIRSNDRPGGMFQFSSIKHIYMEETDSNVVAVERIGGDLTKETVNAQILNGESDFNSPSQSMVFNVGDEKKSFYLFPVDDDLPEPAETFKVVLTSSNGAHISINSTFNVTLRASDDPNGVVSFANTPTNINQQDYERKGAQNDVSFQLSREAGLFGQIVVHWKVESQSPTINTTEQIHPTEGEVLIDDNIKSESITLTIISDKHPEKDQLYTIRLTNITGGARLIEPRSATLTILANDYPVTLSPSILNINEGQTARFEVILKKAFTADVVVTISATPDTALESDFNAPESNITIKAGQTRAPYLVQITDDDIPELMERFRIHLTATTGDTVLHSNFTATVFINPSDDAGGVIQFGEYGDDELKFHEGQTVSIVVERMKGVFGNVSFDWMIKSHDNRTNTSTEARPSYGKTFIEDGANSTFITMVIIQDGIPERDEHYVIELNNAKGDYVRIGEFSSINITILANDRPTGLFRVDSLKSSDELAEDFDDEEGYMKTRGQFTVQRTMGTLFNVSVSWKILPKTMQNLAVLNLPNTDESGIRQNGRCTSITEDVQNSKNISLANGFTIAFDFKTTEGATSEILTFTSFDDNTLFSVLLNDATLEIQIRGQTDSIPLGSGIWHSVFMSISPNHITIYVNQTMVWQRAFTNDQTLNLNGILQYGSGCANQTQAFEGMLKGSWLYGESLSRSEMDDFFNIQDSFNHYEGVLYFPQHQTLQHVNISTVDDAQPEPEMQYIFKIVDVFTDDTDLDREKPIIDLKNNSLVFKVLKSDHINGVFDLLTTNCPHIIHESDQTIINIPVNRTKGFYGAVEVDWRIVQEDGHQAGEDFEHSNGTVFFEDGERSTNITIKVTNDGIPESDEFFTIMLTSATPVNGDLGSSKHSSSTILNSQCNITVEFNDNIHGLFQVMAFRPDNITSAFVKSRSSHAYFDVDEEIGKVDLYVVRTQGTQGSVSIEWKTEATPTATEGIDYHGNLGQIRMADGEVWKRIGIDVIDNDVAELTKSFNVVLKNPTGGASVNNYSQITVNIKPSDNSLGIFQFPSSLNHVQLQEGVTQNVTIVRTKGALDSVSLTWRLVNASSEFEKTSDVVVFGRDVFEAMVELKSLDDKIPEISETFTMELVNVTGGYINQTHNQLDVVVQASDHPYGLFTFEENSIRIEEEVGTVVLTIERKMGRVGQVRVNYQTFVPTDVDDTASENLDFVAFSSHVDFDENEVTKQITVSVIDDNIPEIDEIFGVNITQIQILQPLTDPIDPSTMRGPDAQLMVTILQNDDANGVIEFQQNTWNVSEDNHGRGVVNVTRSRGTFGNITFSFEVTNDGTANLVQDFTVQSFTVIMGDGQSIITLPIFIVQDNLPEFTETFSVRLLPRDVTGGARLGQIQRCDVNIMASDYPHGLFEFESTNHIITHEPITNADNQRISITVLRQYGLNGAVKVQWKITSTVENIAQDISQMEGEVGFLSNEDRAVINLDILPDQIPELNETFSVELISLSLTNAAINTNKKIVMVTILANDNPFGTVMFENQTEIRVVERNSSQNHVTLSLIRIGGNVGDIDVYYRTKSLTASDNSDFISIPDGRANFQNGSSRALITLTIINDTLPELDEMFQVILTKAVAAKQVISLLSDLQPTILEDRNTVNVTIRENDYPYGLFRLSFDGIGVQPGSRDVMIEEPDSNPVSLNIYIEREKGPFGTINITLQMDNGYSITPGIDITGLSISTTVTFRQHERRKSFTVTVLPDDLPEDDEHFVMRLVQPTGGAVVEQTEDSIRFTIPANDDAGGVISFLDGSLSKNVDEGDTVRFTVGRSGPALGTVTVYWRITGVNATQDFVQTQGFIVFQRSTIRNDIQLQVQQDSKPETTEKFKLTLYNVTTTGLSQSGAARLDPSGSDAWIVIGASNYPHGVIEFSEIDQPMKVKESDKSFEIRIVRHFGKLGKLEIYYDILPVANTTYQPASITEDVGQQRNMVTMEENQDTIKITLPLIDDSAPEPDEIFRVNITSVRLASNAYNNSQLPIIGQSSSLDILIEANDGARGELSFTHESVNVQVPEKDDQFNLTVIRKLGAYGDVYCFYFLNRLSADPSDFHISGDVMNGGPSKLVFLDGQRSANITVTIKDDTVPENLEKFEVGLTVQNAVGNGGVVIRSPDRATVSILPNDDANGVFQFTKDSSYLVIPEPESHSDRANRFLRVTRTVGVFGNVSLVWNIVAMGTQQPQIAPSNGVLVFEEYDQEKSFEIGVLEDDVPELAMNVTILLTVISGNGRLGAFSSSTLHIPPNDHPHGVFEITGNDGNTVVYVDESKEFIEVVVTRQYGLYGSVSVDFTTQNGLAESHSGANVEFGLDSMYNLSQHGGFTAAHHFDLASNIDKDGRRSNESYLLVATDNGQSMLYKWMGTFVYVKTISQIFGSKLTSIPLQSSDDDIILASLNVSTIHIAILRNNLTIIELQRIEMYGVTDMLLMQMNGRIHLAVTVGVDRNGDSINDVKLFEFKDMMFTKLPSKMQTHHAKTVASITARNTGHLYFAVGNYYNEIRNTHKTLSDIYRWSGTAQDLKLYGEIETNGVTHLEFFQPTLNDFLYVSVANEKGDCAVFLLDENFPGRFREFQTFAGSCAKMIMFEQNSTVYLMVSNTTSKLYLLDENVGTFKYVQDLPYPSLDHLEIFRVADTRTDPFCLVHPTRSDDMSLWYLGQTSPNSDYLRRQGTLMFEEGQSQQSFYITTLKDSLPEDDESFYIHLSNPTHNSIVSRSKGALKVTIMANDNAFGRIAFSNSSRRVTVTERDHEVAFHLELVREFGTNRDVKVHFEVTAMGSGLNALLDEIRPTKGDVILADGESEGRFILYLQPDADPEILEKFEVRLVSVNTSGIQAGIRGGATLNYLTRTSLISVLPNDHPYGVLSWKHPITVTTEESERNSSVPLVVQRSHGAFGAILVSYVTIVTNDVGHRERPARPGIDFTQVSGNVTLEEGVREVFVLIGINHDKNADFNEVFLVNLTSVELLTSDPSIIGHDPPTIDRNRDITQVVITETLKSNGVISFENKRIIHVSEDVGILQIPLIRTNGSDSAVGVYYRLYHINTTGDDLSIISGIASFEDGQTRSNITIRIKNDDLPELIEMFMVKLTKPVGGASIGDQDTLEIVINENDYPYGLVNFHPNHVKTETEEGETLNITIIRNYGHYGQITVHWSCHGNETNNDFEPTNGMTVFQEGEAAKSIFINILDDSQPEVDEQFECQITSASTPAQVGQHNIISVTILASDKPYGEYMITMETRRVFGMEPMLPRNNGSLFISVRRSGGQSGDSQISWHIQPDTTSPNPLKTFQRIQGVISFADGEKRKRLDLQVKNDQKPEEAQSYILELFSPTGGATLASDRNSTISYITIAASDNPYGVFKVAGSQQYTVNEGDNISVIIERTGGNLGIVEIKYRVNGQNDGDIVEKPTKALLFNERDRIKTLTINTVNDQMPELAEHFSIEFTSATLVNKTIDFNQKFGDFYINIPPTIDRSKSFVNITIRENDYPYGEIGFESGALIYHEWEGLIKIPLIRKGGTHGKVNISLQYTPISAIPNVDYQTQMTYVSFADGQNTTTIDVRLIDDATPEKQESFIIDLDSITEGNAQLSNTTRLTVTIETSDNPNGLIGLFNVSDYVIQNPLTNRKLDFKVQRLAGNVGTIQVVWEIVRTKSSSSLVTEDLSPSSGTVFFPDGNSNPVTVSVDALPYGGPQEEEEKFTFIIRSVTGNAAIDQKSSRISITIKKKGYPNGLFGFTGIVMPSRSVNEPGDGNNETVRIPVKRNFGRLGDVKVRWNIIGQNEGAQTTRDLFYDQSRTIDFKDGQSDSFIDIHVINDDVAELRETFEVRLLSADLDGEIDENNDKITFDITENDNPYGIFHLPSSQQYFNINTTSQSRSLVITVSRTAGYYGACRISIVASHPNTASITKNLDIADGQQSQALIIDVPENSFLPFPSKYSIQIFNVELLDKSPNSDLKPGVNDTEVDISVPEIGANSMITVTDNSKYVTVDATHQTSFVTVTRSGLFGTVRIPWQSGYPLGMANRPSRSKGDIDPSAGVLTIQHGVRSGVITIRVIPDVSPTQPLDYVLHLTNNIEPRPNQNGWPKLGPNIYSVIEPHGIVQIASTSKSVVVQEGSPAVITIIRTYSTVGTIRVGYQTRIYNGQNPAQPGSDFVSMRSSIDFLEGEYSKTVPIQTLDDVVNPQPEQQEFFDVQLISVDVLTDRKHTRSPRLGVDILSTVTILDNDNPFGIFSFAPYSRALTVDESSGSVQLTIERNGGALSQSKVDVLTLGGEETWTDDIIAKLQQNHAVKSVLAEIKNPATGNEDYGAFRSELTFDRQSASVTSDEKTIRINIFMDSVNEPLEKFIVLINNATGGAQIFQPHSYAVVSIRANGFYNGEVGFETLSAIMNEDEGTGIELSITRTGESKEAINITWAASSPAIPDLTKQIEPANGVLKMAAGSSKAVFNINIIQDEIPEFVSWFHVNLTSISSGASIQQTRSQVNVTILDSDYPFGRIAFAVNSRFPVADISDSEVQLVVERTSGLTNTASIQYTTVPLAGMVKDAGIFLNPAVEGSDYKKTAGTLNFAVDQTRAIITVPLLPDDGSGRQYPKIFNVSLFTPTGGASLHTRYHNARVFISSEQSTGQFLKLRSDMLSTDLNDVQIERLLRRLSSSVSKALSDDDQEIVYSTISDILDFKDQSKPGSRAMTSSSRDYLISILNDLANDDRDDTKGKSKWIKLVEKAMYTLTNDWACPTMEIYTQGNFEVTLRRENKSKLNGVAFESGANSFNYPSDLYSSTDTSCTDIQFIDLKNTQWFSGSSGVLNNKVFASSVRTGLGTGKKVVYKIAAPLNRIVPTGASCVLWQHPSSGATQGSWSTNNCKIRQQTNDYVECECDHMSEYAVLAQSDNRTGFEIYFFVACFAVIGACFLQLISHHLCAVERTFPTKLLMHTLCAVMVTNIIYVTAAYISPDLLDHKEQCSVLGLFLHYFFLCQFSTIFVQACNLWKILILNDEHSYRKAIPFYIMAWGLPALLIIGYIFIAHAVWDWGMTDLYGDTHNNGDLCFIPSSYAAFSVAVIPVLLMVLAVCVVFVQAYQVTAQWKYYDDIYHGRHNIKEVRHLLVLFTLITLTWVFGGLHIAYGHLWMAIVFTFFNVFTALYILIIYVVLRNQMRHLFRVKYDIDGDGGAKLQNFAYHPTEHGTVKSIRSYDLPEWNDVDMDPNSPIKKTRQSVTPLSQQRISPQRQMQRPTSSRPASGASYRYVNQGGSARSRGDVNQSYDRDELDSTDFDDLIFALKSSGNFTPSLHDDFADSLGRVDGANALAALNNNDEEGVDEEEESFPDPPPMEERYVSNVRKIRMGDTPL
ncbi:adhesion G-protein coupled receptor V1-like isoform X2 [Clytia hemisphaerica]|uniref:Uncharacterized protein n=1 Tax=Clytia hemisphaerica TaxID=252671 RepID=A0A7M5TQU5_9CNID